MKPTNDQPVYPPKLQAALASPVARIRRELQRILTRSQTLAASEGPSGLWRGSARWASRMAVRLYGMKRLSARIWWARRSDSTALLVAFVDIDGLTRVDRVLGRPAAKRIVAAAGRQLRAALGPGALIFRYGGDEYASATTAFSVDELTERLISARENMLKIRGRAFTAGIAEVGPGDTAYTVVKRAELHMFGAKQSPGVAVSTNLKPVNGGETVEAAVG